MTKRKILAAATVTALPLFLGSTQALSRPSAGPAPTAHTRHVAGQTAGPQWAWAIGWRAVTRSVLGGMRRLSTVSARPSTPSIGESSARCSPSPAHSVERMFY